MFDRFLIVAALGGALFVNPTAHAADADFRHDVAQFLEFYNHAYHRLYTVSQEAQWKSMTDVTPENTGRRIGADEAMASFCGNPHVITQARTFLASKDQLDDVAVRQLRAILRHAAESPGTIPDVVSRRVTAEARQSAMMDGFEFKWMRPGSTNFEFITPNQIDDLLDSSTNLAERLAVWKASKESGVALKAGLLELRDLRNRVAREMGHSSFFALQVSSFDMPTPEMQELLEQFTRDLFPLYLQLHCWARHELARKYAQPVPRLIPAHWINNRWSQEWPGLVTGVNLDPLMLNKSPEWIVRQAAIFGESLGFSKVPPTFWTRSDLYELPSGTTRKKNSHASAWSIDLDQDVRSLQNIKADYTWFVTAHHEFGHTFYQLAYARPEIPFILREGASPAMHEAIAETLAVSPGQLPYLRQLGVVPPGMKLNDIEWLLQLALDQVVFMPWSAGVTRAWEHDFYEENLSADQLNRRWWKYVEKYQGVASPEPRGEEFCDAATKTHINDDPAQYYKYSIAIAIKWQLHMHICKTILKQDPHNANYHGNREAGEFLLKIMRPGATRDWRELIREATGDELGTKPMLEFFQPLMAWLQEQNKGRRVGW